MMAVIASLTGPRVDSATCSAHSLPSSAAPWLASDVKARSRIVYDALNIPASPAAYRENKDGTTG
jgi:hypothetical protein